MGPCHTCSNGTCEKVPAGEQGTCGSGQLCDTNQNCTGGKTANGSGCSGGGNCASGQCPSPPNLCWGNLPTGSYCVNDPDCHSLVCFNNTCT
jgi:hypothetical protein